MARMILLTENVLPLFWRYYSSAHTLMAPLCYTDGRRRAKWILNLSDAIGELTQWRFWLSEINIDVFHRRGVKHQAFDALSRLPIPGENCTAIGDAPTVMAVFISLEEQEKVGTKSTNVIDDYNDNGFNSVWPVLPAVWPMVNSKSGTNTVPPTLTNLLAEQAKRCIWQGGSSQCRDAQFVFLVLTPQHLS